MRKVGWFSMGMINLFSSQQLRVALENAFHGKQACAAISCCMVVAMHCKITSAHPPQKVPVEGLAWKYFAKREA